jgi:hypothetical protein
VPRVLTARFMHETKNPGALVESATVTLHLLRFAPDRARGARTGTESLLTLRWRDMDSNFRFRAKNGRLGYHFRPCAASGWGRSNGGILPGQQAAYRSDKRPPKSERGATVDALPEAGVENGSLRGLRSAI